MLDRYFLFKHNRPDIPFAHYDDPVVETAEDQRRRFFEQKDHLYTIEIFYCLLLEGARSKTGLGAGIARLIRCGQIDVFPAKSPSSAPEERYLDIASLMDRISLPLPE